MGLEQLDRIQGKDAIVVDSNLKLQEENDAGYGQLFAILIRRRYWFLGVIAIAFSIAAFHTSRLESTYSSSMQLLVEPNYRSRPGDVEGEFTDPNVEIDDATQISLMQSSGLLRKAMTELQTTYPEFNPEDPGSVAQFKGALAIGQAAAPNDKKAVTKIYQISYGASDPFKTQNVLKALKKVYLDYNLEQQQLRLSRGLAFINQQLPKVEQSVRESELALEKFRKDQELIDPQTRAQAQDNLLLQVQQEQQKNQTELQVLRSRYNELQQQLGLSKEEATVAGRLSQSSRYQTLLNELQKTDLTLVQQGLRFTEETPFVQQLQEQREKQLQLLRTELNRLLGGGTSAANNESLLANGQLTTLDLSLVSQLVETQVALSSLETRQASLASTEQKLGADLKRFPQLLAEYGRLQPDIELSRATLKQLLTARQELGLKIAQGGFDWQIVEEPQIGFKTGPDQKKNLLLGTVAGLLLAGVVAFLREITDDSVHTSDELRKQVPVPLVGVMPQLPIAQSASPRQISGQPDPAILSPVGQFIHWKVFRESMDLLYQNLQLLNAQGTLKSLVVTSAMAGEGKSTLIMGLAISAARLHQRVLLIDGDLRRPRLHELFNLPNDRGLSSLLTSDAPIPTQISTAGSDWRSNISVLPSGPIPADPAKLLSSPRMRSVMATFEQHYDLVLLDAPPVLGMVDAILAGSCCNGVLMVGRIGKVTRAKFAEAVAMVQPLNLVGVVANGVDVSAPKEDTSY